MKVSMILVAFIVANTLTLPVSGIVGPLGPLLGAGAAIQSILALHPEYAPLLLLPGSNILSSLIGLTDKTLANIIAPYSNICPKLNTSLLCLPILIDNTFNIIFNPGCDFHCKTNHNTKYGRCSPDIGSCSCCDTLLDPNDVSSYCAPLTCPAPPNNITEYSSLVNVGTCNNCTGNLVAVADCASQLHKGNMGNVDGVACCGGKVAYCYDP